MQSFRDAREGRPGIHGHEPSLNLEGRCSWFPGSRANNPRPGMTPESGLPDQHSFADDLAVDQGLYRLRRRFQRKAAPDAWLELALPGEFDQRLDVGGGDIRVGFAKPSDAHPDPLDPLDQKVVGTSQRRGAAEKPEDQDAPAPSEA